MTTEQPKIIFYLSLLPRNPFESDVRGRVYDAGNAPHNLPADEKVRIHPLAIDLLRKCFEQIATYKN